MFSHPDNNIFAYPVSEIKMTSYAIGNKVFYIPKIIKLYGPISLCMYVCRVLKTPIQEFLFKMCAAAEKFAKSTPQKMCSQ